LNGILGFRPSQARYDRRGVFALSESLDTIGIFANSVEDIVLVDQVLASSAGPVQAPILDRTIYDLTDSLDTDWDDDIYEKYRSTLRAYEHLGYEIKAKKLNVFRQAAELFRQYGTLVAIEAKRHHKDLLEGPNRHMLDPLIAQRLNAALDVPNATYEEFLRKRGDAIGAAKDEIGTAVVAYPTVPRTAPSFSEVSASADIAIRENMLLLSNTMIASFLDLPGISMPTGNCKDGLPGSILLSCARGRDDALFSHAQRLQF
jgi:aspartyl-tRNA(Asn)/glutamyl-tRNA(Gln) amidotransferase subunit A